MNAIENVFVSAILVTFLDSIGNPALLSILGSRMLFNMKEAAEYGVNEGTNYMASTVSAIEFDSPPAAEGTRTCTDVSVGSV